MVNLNSIIGNSLRTALLSIASFGSIGLGLANSQESNYSSDSINNLNKLFRQQYVEARNSQLIGVGPVIIVRSDNLVLLRDGKRFVGAAVHPNYHDLKALAHCPLSLFCILENSLDLPLTAFHTKKLASLRDSLAAVESDLKVAFADPEQRSRQVKLVKSCNQLIDRIGKEGRCTAEELDDLVDDLRATVVSNVGTAARMMIDNYHGQMKLWRSELSDKEWEKLYILIPGASLPRKNSLAVGYFAKLFEQEGESNRVIYAESQFDESQDLQLLATHLLDSRIGKVFFDDSSRMNRDLLGPFAHAHLDALDFESLRRTSGRSGADR
jgi:hypothetical protein